MSKTIPAFSALIGCLLLSIGNCWAGWQRDAVCQGACGGACGPCATPGREDRGESAYSRQVRQYNDLVDEAHAAADAGDYAEAVRIARRALAVLDDDGLRTNIAVWECKLLTDQANRTSDSGEKIALVRRALAIYDYPAGRKWLISMEADNLNEQGRRAFAAGDYPLAQQLFAQAEQKNHDPVYADNARRAAVMLKSKQGLSSLIDTVKQSESVSTAASSELEFMPSDSAAASGQGSGPFGTTDTPANPDLVSPSATPAVTANSALEQLSSAAKSGQDADKGGPKGAKGSKGHKMEEAKELTGCGFDGAPCSEPDAIAFPGSAGQTPEANELSSHIPQAGKSDPEIKSSIAWFEKLETDNIETRAKRDEIEKEIATGSGDTALLKAKSATFGNELKRNTADQAKAKGQIKKRLIDLSLEWSESPQEPPSP
jgi:tetratricopeptide (TPR) repeat protein